MPERCCSNRVFGWVGLILILCPTLVRVLVISNPMPWWDVDPSVSPPTGTAITPLGILSLDLITILGAAFAAWGASKNSGRRVLMHSVLFALGSAGVLIHAQKETEHLVVAGPWISGVAALLGAWWLSREPEFRGIILGLGLGVVALLFARSAVQVWIDHPMTVADFAENKEQVLASRGWALGSPQALMYERRLTQPVATGWFGLSNVLATFGAAAGVYGLVSVMTLKALKPRIVLGGLCGIGFAMLWLTGSKGGWGAAGIGLLAAGACGASGRWKIGRSVRMSLPLLAGLGVLGVIALRGFLGERSGELSLLFRSQYIEAAARMFSQHPFTGVGPAGFQDAYLLAKNPLNPEEVTSPHSVFFDWGTTLGVFMVPWAVLLISRLICTSPDDAVFASEEPGETEITRGMMIGPIVVRALILIPIVAFGISAWFERDLLVPIDLGARFLGLAAWIGVALTISQSVRTKTPQGSVLPGVALAAVLFSHIQIELTAVYSGSAPLMFLLLGAAVPLLTSEKSTAEAEKTRISRFGGVLLLLGVLFTMGITGIAPLVKWEHHLKAAAMPMVDAGNRVRLLPGAETEKVLGPARALALESLGRAVDARPNHIKTRIAASRLALMNAMQDQSDPSRWVESARGWVRRSRDISELDAHSLSWLGTIERVLRDGGLVSDPGASRVRSIELLLAAHELDPYNAGQALRLSVLFQGVGEEEKASEWARRALELDEMLRLDELKRLSASDRSLMMGLLEHP